MRRAGLIDLPDWPARMTADIAALYMGISKGSFLLRYRPSGVQEGANVLWARVQLDRFIAKKFSIAQPLGGAADEDESWADLQ